MAGLKFLILSMILKKWEPVFLGDGAECACANIIVEQGEGVCTLQHRGLARRDNGHPTTKQEYRAAET
jgi:hypothetical protein